jgi:hypothetical protein
MVRIAYPQLYRGITRLTFLIGSWAIKLPNPLNGQRMFLEGMLANLKERTLWKGWKGHRNHDLLCPSYYVGFMGFVQIQARCEALQRDLSDPERRNFREITTDTKPINYGLLNGRVVCFDYA